MIKIYLQPLTWTVQSTEKPSILEHSVHLSCYIYRFTGRSGVPKYFDLPDIARLGQELKKQKMSFPQRFWENPNGSNPYDYWSGAEIVVQLSTVQNPEMSSLYI